MIENTNMKNLVEKRSNRIHWWIYIAIMLGLVYFSIKENNWVMFLLATTFTTVYYFLRRKNQKKIDNHSDNA